MFISQVTRRSGNNLFKVSPFTRQYNQIIITTRRHFNTNNDAIIDDNNTSIPPAAPANHINNNNNNNNSSTINKRGMIWSKYDTEADQLTNADQNIYRHNSKIDEMIRVDHAGEFGAVTICQAQLYVLSGDPVIHEILDQERDHFQTFDRLINERRVRPTVLRPFWHVAGTFAGISTAMMGREAAMACHQAVEEVIANHYNEQLREIYDLSESNAQRDADFERMMQEDESDDAKNQEYFFSSPATNANVRQKEEELRRVVRQYRDEEMHHHQLAEENKAIEAPFYKFIYNSVKAGCQAAIWLAKRI